LLRPQLLKEKLQRSIEEKNTLFQHHFGAEPISLDEILQQCLQWADRLKPFIADTRLVLNEAIRQNRPILFEGAQGTLLDVDYGTYPYVTSSSTVAGGALTGTGLGFNSKISHVIGITKAYTTRVGTGPFPTEIEQTEKETAEKIRAIGAEFGATTGRPRRTGWLDLVALKFAVQVNGITGLALMKSDVLQGFDFVKLCTSYQLGGTTVYDFPSSIEDQERVQPVYEILPGWEKISGKPYESTQELPVELRNYVKAIEDFVGVPVVLISTGPGREETLLIQNPFF
jgi:adenylosuccinate synthase